MTSFAERLEPRRLLAAGDLDATFGAGGSVDIELSHPLFGVQRVIPITGGDLLVIGQEIRRFNPDGSLDRTFGGGDGVIPLAQSISDGISHLENAAILPDGRVLAVLLQPLDGAAPSRRLMAFNADGSPAGDMLPMPAEGVEEFAVQGDGKILLIGKSQVMRLTNALQRDTTFGDAGSTPGVISDSAFDRAADGSFFAVGLNQAFPPKQAIMKFTANGALDTSFGNGGEVITSNAGATAVTDVEIDSNGTLLTVTGGKIRRLSTNGQFDSSFGDGGASDPTFGDIFREPPRLTLLPGGKVLVTAGTGVTRLTGDGDIDPTYGRVIADLKDHGVLGANAAGEVFFTAAGRTTPLALYRLAANGSTPGLIHLDNGTLFCTGSEGVDEMSASRRNGDLVISRRRDDVSRVFDPADVTLLNFSGLGGNDVITLASAGNIASTVSGGDGNDKILGGDGPDSLSGNAGRDTIYGGNGADRLGGNGARDKLIGEGGADRLYGGSSGDWLLGMGGDDQLFGEGGNDYLSGGSGFDTLRGNAGDDLLIANDSAIDNGGWVDYLFGDGGRDSSIADPNDVLSSIEVRLSA